MYHTPSSPITTEGTAVHDWSHSPGSITVLTTSKSYGNSRGARVVVVVVVDVVVVEVDVVVVEDVVDGEVVVLEASDVPPQAATRTSKGRIRFMY